MPMTMNRKGDNENRFDEEPGTYQFTLKKIIFDQGSEYEDKTKTFPQARMIWVDADGDEFSDGFIRVPNGFKLNENAKWTNRLAALVGRKLTDEDAAKIELDLGEDISSYDDLAAVVADKDDRGKGVTVTALSLTFEGKSLFETRPVLLNLGKNDKGYMTCGAKDASPVPQGGKKKKTSMAAAEPEGDAEGEADPF